MQKPHYRTSKRYMLVSQIAAWIVIFTVVIAGCLNSAGALSLSSTVIPIMAGLVAAMLGIHRVTGSKDMQTLAKQETEGRRD
ncbi:NAD(P)+ transhydrogenase beta chain [Martelella limonii]|uniref:NAD(P)+ transhydrogenase beta chain n=1 Tax=Martelella limonii TaxID=1647649 RepID=UPI00158014A9|nr:NAD(P)+ transhydrogenase beta chain [Martelella limonii]